MLVIRERRLQMTWAMLVPRKGTEFPWIATRSAKLGPNRVTLRCDNEPTIEGNRTSLPCGKPDRSRETTIRGKPVQLDHRAHSGARGWSGQNTEGCAGAWHCDQSPARRKSTVLAGGIRNERDEQMRHRQRRKDTYAWTALTDGRTTC